MSQKHLLLSPRDECVLLCFIHGHQSCFTSLVGLVDKTNSRPFGDLPKRTHADFDCKVKRPAVNLERQVQRHRTADSLRLFLDVMYAPPAVAVPAPFVWNQCHQRVALHKHLPFEQKLQVRWTGQSPHHGRTRCDLRPSSQQTAVTRHLTRHRINS